MSGAAASPNGLPQEGPRGSTPTGDGGVEHATCGSYNPNWLEADPEGTLERTYSSGRGAASSTAPLPAGFQPLGVQGSAPTEDVSVIRTTSGPCNPGWLEASPEGIHSEGTTERAHALGHPPAL